MDITHVRKLIEFIFENGIMKKTRLFILISTV